MKCLKITENTSLLPILSHRLKNRKRINVTSFFCESLIHQLDIQKERFNNFATLAFPTPFPDCKGDLITKSTVNVISHSETDSFSQKVEHLEWFCELINGKWC